MSLFHQYQRNLPHIQQKKEATNILKKLLIQSKNIPNPIRQMI
jgi:hypothetical protein